MAAAASAAHPVPAPRARPAQLQGLPAPFPAAVAVAVAAAAAALLPLTPRDLRPVAPSRPSMPYPAHAAAPPTPPTTALTRLHPAALPRPAGASPSEGNAQAPTPAPAPSHPLPHHLLLQAFPRCPACLRALVFPLPLAAPGLPRCSPLCAAVGPAAWTSAGCRPPAATPAPPAPGRRTEARSSAGPVGKPRQEWHGSEPYEDGEGRCEDPLGGTCCALCSTFGQQLASGAVLTIVWVPTHADPLAASSIRPEHYYPHPGTCTWLFPVPWD